MLWPNREIQQAFSRLSTTRPVVEPAFTPAMAHAIPPARGAAGLHAVAAKVVVQAAWDARTRR